MLRIGGTASPGHITVFRGLKTHFQQQGIALDWVLYADYDALVEAFATREIDLAWNGPIRMRGPGPMGTRPKERAVPGVFWFPLRAICDRPVARARLAAKTFLERV